MPLHRFENMGLYHLKGMSEYKIPIFNGKNLIYRILGHILDIEATLYSGLFERRKLSYNQVDKTLCFSVNLVN